MEEFKKLEYDELTEGALNAFPQDAQVSELLAICQSPSSESVTRWVASAPSCSAAANTPQTAAASQDHTSF